LIVLAMSGFVVVRSVVADPLPTLTGIGIAAAVTLLWFPLQRYFP
jgi:hypothetical protein